MRNLIGAILVTVAGAGLAAAQDVETTSKSRTKLTVEGGKEVTVTGCVARAADGGFTLTNAAGKGGALGSYVLVADEGDADELGGHVGHRIEVKGRAADQGDGRLKIRTKSEVETSTGDTKKRESTTEVKGNLEGLPFLSVKSVRMLASVCP